MLEVNPDLGPFDVKRMLVATAQDQARGLDPDFGYGFVNAIAAVQVARDPALLDSPRFASALSTLPEPPPEDFRTKMTTKYRPPCAEGKLPLYAGLALLLVAALILGVVAIQKLRRL